MIRCTTVIALLVAIGLACVFGKGSDAEEPHRDSQVHLKEDPHVDLVAKIEDQEEVIGNEKSDLEPEDQNENDPFFFSRKWKRRKWKRKYYCKSYWFRKRKKCTQKPSPTPPPPPTPPPCSSSIPVGNWLNKWHESFLFKCKTGDSIISVKSVHRSCQHDRLWEFGCGFNEASKEHCHWTHGYANDAKHGITFKCPNNGFLTGVDSAYIDGDRRFKFQCCNNEDFECTNLHMSHQLNKPGEDFEFKVERDKRWYISGVYCHYDPATKDRTWKFGYCRSEPEHGYYPKPELVKKDEIKT